MILRKKANYSASVILQPFFNTKTRKGTVFFSVFRNNLKLLGTTFRQSSLLFDVKNKDSENATRNHEQSAFLLFALK